jgi:alkylated DNA nucleotide flippase Atl1
VRHERAASINKKTDRQPVKKGGGTRQRGSRLIGDPTLDVASRRSIAQGVGGTTAFGGYVEDRETSSALRGSAKYTTYSDLLANVGIVAASVRYILNLVARPSWTFDPADDSDEAKRMAELVSNAFLKDLKTPWRRVIRRASTYRLYGFGLQEWTMARHKKGHLAITDVEPRPQRTIEKWDIDDTGTVYAVGQRSPHDGKLKAIPRYKLMYLVDDSLSDSPEGFGVLRQVANACRQLLRYEQLEGWGYETNLKGVPVARLPYMYLAKLVKDKKITKAERDAIIKPLEDITKNHIMVPNLGLLIDSITYTSKDATGMPSQTPLFNFDTIKGGGPDNAQGAVHQAIERLLWNIARTFGTESLLLGSARGSFALSKDKTQNLLMVIDGILADIVDQVYMDLVTAMFEENDWDLDLRPQVKTDVSQYRDIEEITGALKDIAQAGAVMQPDDPAIDVVRKALGLPRQPEVRVSDLVSQAVAEATGGLVGPDGKPVASKPPGAAVPGAKPGAVVPKPMPGAAKPAAATQNDYEDETK